MSGECDECNQHAVDCECIQIIPWERKWISKEEAKKIFNKKLEDEEEFK